MFLETRHGLLERFLGPLAYRDIADEETQLALVAEIDKVDGDLRRECRAVAAYSVRLDQRITLLGQVRRDRIEERRIGTGDQVNDVGPEQLVVGAEEEIHRPRIEFPHQPPAVGDEYRLPQ